MSHIYGGFKYYKLICLKIIIKMTSVLFTHWLQIQKAE